VAELILSDDARGIHVAPIRHHSPACAFHLTAMIEELAPAAVLVEGPCDFDPLIPLLVDPRTRPPVAIVSIADVVGGRSVSTFPFCAHSPEYVALAQARARGIGARFIDLPAGAKAMLREAGNGAPPPSVDEHAFDTSDYVRALAERLGCRDGNEVWDHLFEARIGRGDWRTFFADVGRYCEHMRACTPAATMASDGTLARETQMIAHLAAARREVTGPILAVVGGFHAPALAGADLASAGDRCAPPAERPISSATATASSICSAATRPASPCRPIMPLSGRPCSPAEKCRSPLWRTTCCPASSRTCATRCPALRRRCRCWW
jgi:hypothetical protein